METKFSPNLLDNDPNFEYKPSKVIKVDSQAWFDWLSANDSFRFNAGDNSYRARKEYNIPAKTDYWYAVKKVNGKLHKKFIGKGEQVTHARLIEISKVIMQPPHPRKPAPQETTTTPQETSAPDLMELIKSLSLRLDNLENKQEVKMSDDNQLFEDAIARLKYELHNKEIQISELNNRLANADVHLCHVNNDLYHKEKKLSELTKKLYDKDMQLLELTKQLDNANSKLTELTNELSNANIQLFEVTNELTNKDSKPSEGTNQLDNSLVNSDVQLSEGTNELDNELANSDENKTKLINLLGLDDILSGDLYNADILKKDGYFKAMADNKEEIAKITGIEVKLADDLTDMNAIIKWLGYKSIRTTHNKISYRKIVGKI